jgi:ABC-type transporter Mla subunit MlaD
MARLELGVDITVEGSRELGKVADSLGNTSDELDDLALKLDDAADAARRASDDIDKAAGSLRFEGANAGAETLENAGEGLRNFANGTADAFQAATDSSLSFQDRFTLAAGGVADVANGMRNAIIPAMQAIAAGSLKTMVASVTSLLSLL